MNIPRGERSLLPGRRARKRARKRKRKRPLLAVELHEDRVVVLPEPGAQVLVIEVAGNLLDFG